MNVTVVGVILKQLPRPYINYIIVVVAYFLLIILLPANNLVLKLYQINSGQYHILLFLAVLPLVAVWFAAFYGYYYLARYVIALHGAPETPHFARLSKGSTWLAWSLVVPSFISLILNGIANSHPGFHSTALIIANYANILMPLIALTLISAGARGLSTHNKIRLDVKYSQLMVILFVLIGIIYCFLTFRNLDLQTTTNTANPYFLPTWLILVTITAPSLYTWFVGLVAAFDISQVARRTPGLLYKRALQLLSSGLVLVIVCLVAIQYTRSVTPRVGHLSINGAFLTVNIFYLIAISGFVLMCLGANRLKKIEEV